MITEIRHNSKWVALEDFRIGVGSHCWNPNTTALTITKGTILNWEDDSPNGNVWFNVEVNGENYRGKVECGRITNAINSGRISLLDNGDGMVAYSGDFLQRLLS